MKEPSNGRASLVPSKVTAGRPPIAEATRVGWLAAVPWAALRALPDLSAHAETAPPEVVRVEASSESSHRPTVDPSSPGVQAAFAMAVAEVDAGPVPMLFTARICTS